MLSHFTVAAVGLVILLVAIGANVWLKLATIQVAEVSAPITLAAENVQAGVQNALASLRGWVFLGDRRHAGRAGQPATAAPRPGYSGGVAMVYRGRGPDPG